MGVDKSLSDDMTHGVDGTSEHLIPHKMIMIPGKDDQRQPNQV